MVEINDNNCFAYFINILKYYKVINIAIVIIKVAMVVNTINLFNIIVIISKHKNFALLDQHLVTYNYIIVDYFKLC